MAKKRTGSNPNLTVTTINIPTRYKRLMEKLVALGVYPSMSEVIRAMMGEWLTEKFRTIDTIDKLIDQADRLLDYNKEAQIRSNANFYKNTEETIELVPTVYDIETSFVEDEIIELNDGSKLRVREHQKLDTESWIVRHTDKDGFIVPPKIIETEIK